MTAVLLAGGAVGLGVLLLLTLLWEREGRTVSAAADLAALDARRARRRRESALEASAPATTAAVVRLRRAGRAVVELLDGWGVHLPAGLLRDLSMVGRPLDTHLAYSVIGGVVGLVVPTACIATVSLIDPSLSAGAPLWAGLLGVVVGTLLPTVHVTSRAGVRRRDFRHVIGSFLDLVAMNLAGGRGVPEALQTAANISQGWAMVRIRDTLVRARLQGIAPWAALGELGADTGVPELDELGAALALVADDGAKVRDSLSARAASLRRRELADAEGRAQARSQSMLVAQMLLAVGFLIFLIYPAFSKVLAS